MGMCRKPLTLPLLPHYLGLKHDLVPSDCSFILKIGNFVFIMANVAVVFQGWELNPGPCECDLPLIYTQVPDGFFMNRV